MNQDETGQDEDQRIKVRAHQIWEAEGRPHGRHDEHWRQAKQEAGMSAGPSQALETGVEVEGRRTSRRADRPANTGQIDADRAADAAPGPRVEGEDLRERQERLLDEALEETFPGSDPIAPKRIT